MTTPPPVALRLIIALGVLSGLSGRLLGQVPTQGSEPRLAVPRATVVTQAPGQPTIGQTTPAQADPTQTTAPTPTVEAAPASGPTKLGTPPQQAVSSSAQAATMGNRSYAAGNFALLVEGSQVGPLKSVEGGVAVAEVKTNYVGSASKKNIVNVHYEPITALVSIGAKPVLDWVAQSWKGINQFKSGTIVTDLGPKASGEWQFVNGVIAETTVPELSPSSKDVGYFTIKIDPEQVHPTSGTSLKADFLVKQKRWQASNFRFDMDGLDGSKVAKIESFTVRQNVAADQVGMAREAAKQLGQIEFPNLTISLWNSSAASWNDWYQSFVVNGKNGDDQEKNGAIVFLTQDMKTELGRVSLFNCGIVRLAPEKMERFSDRIGRVSAELYCERMELAMTGAASN